MAHAAGDVTHVRASQPTTAQTVRTRETGIDD
jgi:hypothetical protein